jgi:hypothetical protein
MDAPIKNKSVADEGTKTSSARPRNAPKLATEFEIRDSIAAVRDALDRSCYRKPNTWVFFSNKNDQLLTIEGDLYFIVCTLLEGDFTVSSYSFEPPRSGGRNPSVFVHRSTGIFEAYGCESGGNGERLRGDSRPNNTAEQGVQATVLTERDLAPRMTEFANWLMLSGAMTRARSFSTAVEVDALLSVIKSKGCISFQEALSLEGTDPALMLSCIAKGLSSGALFTDLRSKLLTTGSVISAPEPSSSTTPVTAIPFSTRSEGARGQGHSGSIPLSMPRNRRTLAYRQLFSDPQLWLKDEIPDVPESAEQRRRTKAVQLYLYNRPYSEIQLETGFSGSWVRKLFRRTLNTNKSGKPVGVDGLTPYRRARPYERKSELPKSNMEEGQKGGFAGAFSSLIAQYPPLLQIIESEVLKKRVDIKSVKPKIREARVTWVDLHGRMKDFLADKGVRNDEYPFNTRDVAYSSLVTLCNAILFNRPIRWIESRGGKDAVRRSNLGSGKSSLITAQWLNQIVELDYQKCDSASIIEVTSPKNTVVDVPTARWWAGAIVECYSECIIATSDSFESQATEDCVMELVDVGISAPTPLERLARLKNCPDGAWLPTQMIPEYGGQAWDVLKLDRAWAHKSTTALAAIVATVGCAICYGAPRDWFARHLVERTFEKLTQAGPQALPSTLGTGPADGRKDNPDLQALRFRFKQDDVCDLIKSAARWINETSNEGVFWATPLATIKAAMTHETQRYFPRPLPRARVNDRPLMWHTIPCKIEGNATNGTSPCVRPPSRTRFRGTELSKSWHLVGVSVYLQVFRRDIRTARVLLATTGELIGNVRPEEKWMNMAVSWRDHALIQKFGKINKRHQRSSTPVQDFLDIKQEDLLKAKKPVTQKKRDAATVARIVRNAKHHAAQNQASETAQELPNAPVDRTYQSILGPAPQIGATRRADRHG